MDIVRKQRDDIRGGSCQVGLDRFETRSFKVGGEDFTCVTDDTSAVARCELDRLSSRRSPRHVVRNLRRIGSYARATPNRCNFTDFLFLSLGKSRVPRESSFASIILSSICAGVSSVGRAWKISISTWIAEGKKRITGFV